jgi:chemotaxis protein CheX
MNAEIINPFLNSMVNILHDMAGTEAKPGKIFLKKTSKAGGDVTGIIGLAGESTRGSLAVSFPEPVILFITSKMLGETYSSLEPIVIDMVCEIVNMVLGSAKQVLSENGYRFEMAIPSTVAGRGHTITHKTDGPVIVVPFDTEAGDFYIEVCFER